MLLDALAKLEADEADQVDRGARVLGSSRDDITDRSLVVADEQLAEQRVLLAELGEAALDHLLDDIVRLAAFARLFQGNRALALDHGGVDRIGVERLRV